MGQLTTCIVLQQTPQQLHGGLHGGLQHARFRVGWRAGCCWMPRLQEQAAFVHMPHEPSSLACCVAQPSPGPIRPCGGCREAQTQALVPSEQCGAQATIGACTHLAVQRQLVDGQRQGPLGKVNQVAGGHPGRVALQHGKQCSHMSRGPLLPNRGAAVQQDEQEAALLAAPAGTSRTAHGCMACNYAQNAS